MQGKHRKFHKYLGMTLDYSTVGQVNLTMLDYIDEIINFFDRSDPTGGNTKQIAAPDINFKAANMAKKLMQNKLWSFITWWQKYYLLTDGPGRTPEPHFHSSPREWDNPKMKVGTSWSI